MAAIAIVLSDGICDSMWLAIWRDLDSLFFRPTFFCLTCFSRIGEGIRNYQIEVACKHLLRRAATAAAAGRDQLK
jgi:hypothetical protein